MNEHLRFRLGSTNVYALVDDAGVLLIDAGPDYEGAWEELVAGLAPHGISTGDVRAVVLTHGHRDHAGLAARWQQAGAEVWAGRADAPLLALDTAGREALRAAAWRVAAEVWGGGPHPHPPLPFLDEGASTVHGPGDADSPAMGHREGWNETTTARSFDTDGPPSEPLPHDWGPGGARSERGEGHTPNYRGALAQVRSDHGSWPGPLRMTPVAPDRLLDDGDRMESGRIQLRVQAAPGHTPGSVLLRRSETGAVYTGDHLLPRMVATVGIQVENGVRVPSMPGFVEALRRMASMSGAVAYPGHGEPIPDTGEAARWSLRYLERRLARIRRLLTERPRTVREIATTLYPHLRPEHELTVTAEVLGLLDLIDVERRAATAAATAHLK